MVLRNRILYYNLNYQVINGSLTFKTIEKALSLSQKWYSSWMESENRQNRGYSAQLVF